MKQYYINAASCLSPQKTFEGFDALHRAEPIYGINLPLAEPDYKQFINPVQIRRMSRFNKFGLSAAKMCLQEAALTMPDAIITATGYGSIGETRQCILDLYNSNEQNVVPNQFMQTTPNSIAGLIALGLKCNNYNFTYVHRGFSFENALQDAMLQLDESDSTKSILVGASDETTEDSLIIYQRIGQYKTTAISNLDLFRYESAGALKGEGAAFFVLSNQLNNHSYAKLNGTLLCYKPASIETLVAEVSRWLQEHNATNFNLLMTGRNGDANDDSWYQQFKQHLFPSTPEICFKHLCGEYATASSFATWIAANVLRTQSIPEVLRFDGAKQLPVLPQGILIYNHYFARNHAFLLLERA